MTGWTVAEAMVTSPKTLPTSATVGDARAAFRDDHVHLLLIVGPRRRLVATVGRWDLEKDSADDLAVLSLGTLQDRTIRPDLGAQAALELMVETGTRRRAVVDEDGILLGLLCLKRSWRGFCSDANVLERAG
ncbi:MAG: CBS domain-containing protein [Sporichthyaceae bacterium]